MDGDTFYENMRWSQSGDTFHSDCFNKEVATREGARERETTKTSS